MIIYGGSSYQTYTNGDLYFLKMSDQTRTSSSNFRGGIDIQFLTGDALEVSQLTDMMEDSTDDEEVDPFIDFEKIGLLDMSGKSTLNTISTLRAHSATRSRNLNDFNSSYGLLSSGTINPTSTVMSTSKFLSIQRSSSGNVMKKSNSAIVSPLKIRNKKKND